jgi:hypothetical protein
MTLRTAFLATTLLAGLSLAAAALPGTAAAADEQQEGGPSFGTTCSDLQAHFQEKEGRVSYSFVTPRSGDPAVDAKLAAFVDGLKAEALKEGKANPPPADSAGDYEYDLYCWVVENGPKLASYVFLSYQFTGGAHGISALHSLNFDKADAGEIAFADLFADQAAALKRLSDLAVAALEKQLGEAADKDWIAKGAGPEAENFRIFALGEDGLHLLFDQYQVGAGYLGQQQVTIPYAELDGLWSDRLKALLGRD